MKNMLKIIKNWVYVDTRTLALFRIFFGLMGLIDVMRRYSIIDVFYSDMGMNFRRQVTSKYSIKYFSLLDHLHSSIEVRLFFIATIICFILLIVGYRTRLFQVLSAMGLLSIHNAAVILENGADMVYNNYLIWMLFLPLGTSMSIDSLRNSFKSELDNDLNKPIISKPQQVFHIAYIACLIQLSMIYFLNHINKSGNMWADGTAVHYMYQLDTFLTPLGSWIISIISLSITKILTTTTIYIELLGPLAILSPFFQPWLRRIAVFVFMIFHLVIGISVNIGMFSWVMMAVLVLIIDGKAIDYLKSLLSKLFNIKYTVFYDRDCGICHFLARLLKRMDIFSRLTWSDRLSEGDKPENINNLLETTIIVWNREKDIIWTRHNAFSKIISVLPFGFLVSWILRVPLLEKIFGYIYDVVSTNRARFSQLVGLPACGIERLENTSESSPQKKPLFKNIRIGILLLTNIIAFILIIGVVDYSIQINDGVKKYFEKNDKKLVNASNGRTTMQETRRKMKRILLYPRMYQEWNMFSPKVITYEKWVLADISFDNGDDLTLFKNDDRIEKRFNYQYFNPYSNQFWRKLFGRLGKSNYSKYIPRFKEWLAKTDYFPEFEGRKVSNVKLWQLSEKSLVPGQSESEHPKVTKRELKKKQKRAKGAKKNKSRVKKPKGYKVEPRFK